MLKLRCIKNYITCGTGFSKTAFEIGTSYTIHSIEEYTISILNNNGQPYIFALEYDPEGFCCWVDDFFESNKRFVIFEKKCRTSNLKKFIKLFDLND